MLTQAEQVDRRMEDLRPWASLTTRPSQGWIKAIRTALGMTTGQLAKRLMVAQPRVSQMEAAEVQGNLTLKSLNRAAEALDCRVIYVLVPIRPLSETLNDRARLLAERQLAAIEQTMRLEDQAVGKQFRQRALDDLVEDILRHPSKLWDNA